jgi:hypothetical protein
MYEFSHSQGQSLPIDATAARAQCPLHPDSGQTFAPQRNVALCQEETRAGAATNGHKVARLLDHFIGEREQIVRDREAERLGSLEIYHKLESTSFRSCNRFPVRSWEK